MADLSSEATLEWLAAIPSNDASITVLVNNAGTSTLGSLAESKLPERRAMMNVNVLALARLTVAVLPGFKKRNYGTIVNVGSVRGFAGWRLAAFIAKRRLMS